MNAAKVALALGSGMLLGALMLWVFAPLAIDVWDGLLRGLP